MTQATKRWRHEKVTGLSGEVESRYVEQPKEDEKPYPALVVTATKQGVRVAGNSCWLMDMQALQEFAEIISNAWADHKKLLSAQIHIARPGGV